MRVAGGPSRGDGGTVLTDESVELSMRTRRLNAVGEVVRLAAMVVGPLNPRHQLYGSRHVAGLCYMSGVV